MKLNLIVFFALLAVCSSSLSHSGRTNASGCHNNRKTGGYHCHNGGSSSYSRKSSLSSSYSNNRTLSNNKYDKNLVLKIQQLLKSQGYKIKKADGIYGDETKKAIKHFQVDQDLNVNGLPSYSVLVFLEAASK